MKQYIFLMDRRSFALLHFQSSYFSLMHFPIPCVSAAIAIGEIEETDENEASESKHEAQSNQEIVGLRIGTHAGKGKHKKSGQKGKNDETKAIFAYFLVFVKSSSWRKIPDSLFVLLFFNFQVLKDISNNVNIITVPDSAAKVITTLSTFLCSPDFRLCLQNVYLFSFVYLFCRKHSPKQTENRQQRLTRPVEIKLNRIQPGRSFQTITKNHS